MPRTKEPSIIINGTILTDAQAMAVRVAVSSFFMSLQDAEYGDSNMIEALYRKRLMEIQRLILEG